MGDYVFKIASEPQEFEQIHRLNYRTFVEEIPQHAPNPEHRLVDKFHAQNTYIICLNDGHVIGMMAVRGDRPFSLDSKIENLDSYLPQAQGRKICETRLLAVDPEHRNGKVFGGMLRKLLEHSAEKGYDFCVISGTVRQQRLYRHLGFLPFGPLVGTADALYQPMYLSLEIFRERVSWIPTGSETLTDDAATTTVPAPQPQGMDFAIPEGERAVNLLPGPVSVHPDVQRAFSMAPVSHRSDQFAKDVQNIKRMLCGIVDARNVELLLGTGTLANDVIAAQLTSLNAPGLILISGEFGERLLDHATRFGLQVHPLRFEWGAPFDYDRIERCLDDQPAIRWLWFVHCETSTGILNDLPRLSALCGKRPVRLCADCISSVGTVLVGLQDVYLASCVSGKGLAGFPGLGMVFYNHEVKPSPNAIPRYLDLGYYAEKNGTPFTSSSNLLYALQAALKRFRVPDRFDVVRRVSGWLRPELRRRGFRILAPDEHASPAVITLVLPPEINSNDLGHCLDERGYLLSYKSEYLLRRNWIQICLMGENPRESIAPLLDILDACARKARK